MQLSISHMILNAGLMGQFIILVLLVFSIISWSIIFMKTIMFRRIRKQTETFMDSFWSSNNISEADSLAAQFPSCPQAVVFNAGYNELQKINKARARKEKSPQINTLDTQLAAMDNLKRAIRKAESQEINRISQTLPFLATTGSATPFIGLFGTVWGIMASFHDIGIRGSASLAVVAPGISEALVATAAGLAVAIPAVIFYNHFSNKVAVLDDEMQNFSTDFLNLVERDLLGRMS